MTENALQIALDRPIDLICMGRVAVDLYAEQIGSSLADASTFRKYLGGCAGNIAVGTARLGLKSMMFSCVGNDEMGKFIKKTLHHEGVSTDLLYETDKHLTGLVLLGVKPPRDFPLIFYRNDCADMQLKAGQINASIIKQAKAVLITGTGLSTPSMRETTLQLVEVAKKFGTKIILDIDFRPVLWGLTSTGNGETRYLTNSATSGIYQTLLPHCDLIVGTEEEICIAGGAKDVMQSLGKIRSLTAAPVVLKLGEQGCHVYFHHHENPLFSKPFPVEVLNVLGAGDGFMAGLLRGLLRGETWEKATTYANACGALVVTRHGCSPAIPYWDELNYFIGEYDQDPFVWKSKVIAQLHGLEMIGQRRFCRLEAHAPGPRAEAIASPQSERIEVNDLIKRPFGFADGINPIVTMTDNPLPVLMNFSSIKLRKGQQYTFNRQLEFAALLMTGRVTFHFDGQSSLAERSDYFSQSPFVLHCPAGITASFDALTDCEILLIETENEHDFQPMLFSEQNSLENDHRGKDLLEDTSYRLVRTVFDKRNRPESNLVVGEIITFQGRWSSYPSHFHSQPEIYHYRFSEPQGYAFGENGKDVIRIEHNDTYQITAGQTHAHCTAPGYALYTLWFIRHQQNQPYLNPTFTTQHEWTRTPASAMRVWKSREGERK